MVPLPAPAAPGSDAAPQWQPVLPHSPAKQLSTEAAFPPTFW